MAWTLTKALSIRSWRRLETQGLLVSEWREEDKRNKDFTFCRPKLKPILQQLLAERKNIDSSLTAIVKGYDHATN